MAENDPILERRGRIEDLDRSFDLEYWRRQGPEAGWRMVEEHFERTTGKSASELRMDKSVERYGKIDSDEFRASETGLGPADRPGFRRKLGGDGGVGED